MRSWKTICYNIEPSSLASIVDEASVRQLQALAPGTSRSDAFSVTALLQDGTFFPGLRIPAARAQLLTNIMSFDGMIPSLFTFFEDLKYLEPAAKILRKLLPEREKRSLWPALSAYYFTPARSIFECPQGQFNNLDPAWSADAKMRGYYVLWLFALRNFPEMINIAPRKDPTKSKPQIVEPNPRLWREFGSLTLKVGFRTPAAEALASQGTHQELASKIIQQQGFQVEHNRDAVEDLSLLLARLRRANVEYSPPAFVADDVLSAYRRYGRPFEEDHHNDKDVLFLPTIYQEAGESGGDITTAFRKRHMFRSFFAITTVCLPSTVASMLGLTRIRPLNCP